MCGVSLIDRVPSEELTAWVGVEPISDVCRKNRLRWFGHVQRKGDDDWVKRCTRLEVVGKRPRGRPRKTWMTTLKDDYEKRCSVPGGCKGEVYGGGSMVQNGRPGLTWIYHRCYFTYGSAIKPTVCVMLVFTKKDVVNYIA
jgi:hypothetical protein